MTNKMLTKVEGNVLILERVFDAPRELVFEAFTKPEHLKRWWGPRGWTLTVCEVDFRPGGVWHYCMKCEDEKQGDFYGMESWGKGIYHEIEAPGMFTYTDYFSDAEGNENTAMPSTEVTNSFLEQDGKTKLVSRAEYASEEALKTVLSMGMEQGITETWDRLAEHLQSIR
ncbi:SRPBCC domain-containing protein [Cohnella sp. CFH 77786]|uniref:SRPBCC domain-containing protein n=1 Tax=Cohnella sp. CFH 77786 TaxID=2662265 RepID=UPI001C60C250|nr:SRPBCC domain-containing protein [Cohnella sp. CFH 77786]MBW5447709.1 SRPBCC domain-containing protein [Cohnella sp. CFH 77786]